MSMSLTEHPDTIWILPLNATEAHNDGEDPDWQHGVWYPHDLSSVDQNSKKFVAAPANPAPVKFRVRPLKWTRITNTEAFSVSHHGVTEYTVIPTGNGEWRVYGISSKSDGGLRCSSLEEATTKVRAHFEARIRAAVVLE